MLKLKIYVTPEKNANEAIYARLKSYTDEQGLSI